MENGYPKSTDIKSFDLHKKHFLYGRIDSDGDAIYLDDHLLEQISSGPADTHLALNFVCAAFEDFRTSVKTAANRGYLSLDSLFPSKPNVTKSWRTVGGIESGYDQYLNKLYTSFVDRYLSTDKRADKIKDFSSFTKEFIKFVLQKIEKFPLTRTGYISSIHCSPLVSGLMIEIAPELHGLPTNARIINYINDPNFNFFVNESKKFGFMIDKNAPWRMVFNLASGEEDRKIDPEILQGGQKYMNDFATGFSNVFKVCYRKAYLDEVLSLRKKIWNLYDNFYKQFSTYKETKYIVCEKGETKVKSSFSIKQSVVGRLVVERKNRKPPPVFASIPANQGLALGAVVNQEIEYWLKIVLKLRMSETATAHTPQNFRFFIDQMVENHRLFGLDAALNYINDLTRGQHVTNFLSRGAYWYGLTREEYENRKRQALEHAKNPSIVDYSLTGTANIK
tara:strand:+ start:14466 stop:15815 length:1350 start_codon:yes stop_codon:yes gene_type:complete